MDKDIGVISKILLKYSTENTNEKPNPNITPCLREVFSYLKKKGVHSVLQEYVVKGKKTSIKHANLLAFDQKTKTPFILFQGHIDTVPTGIESKAKIGSEKIIGRGAVDMKGSLAGMVDAVISLSKNTKILKYQPALLITGDEEANFFAGIKNFLKRNRNLPILFSICGEPSNFEMQTSFKGVIGYTIEKKGEENHSAYPGENPLIEGAVPAIVSIKNFLDESRKISDKKFGKTVAAFTVISSGEKDNQMPRDIRFAFNLRTVRRKEVYNALFERIVRPTLKKNVKLKCFSFDPLKARVPNKLKNILKDSFREIGMGYKESTTTFFTEASIMNMHGIPTIVCGPGNPRLAHGAAEKEVIKTKDIERYSALLQMISKNISKIDCSSYM